MNAPYSPANFRTATYLLKKNRISHERRYEKSCRLIYP